MKILFVLENTMTDLHGGTEVSSYHLARLLRKKGIGVEEWTPFPKRKSQFWYTCLAGQIYIFIKLVLYLLKNRQNVLHVQGKYLIPPAVVAGKLFGIPTVVTIRDYMVVCPIGLCLFETFSRHGFGWYVMMELPKFLSIYHSTESASKKMIRTGLMVRGWFVSKYLKWWLKKADKVIAVSEATQNILKENGIKSQIIYNTFDIRLYKDCPPPAEDSPLGKEIKNILFVGKPSYGKGYDLFLSLSRNKLFKNYNFKTIGGDNKLDYSDTLKEIKQALTVVVPSRWPEPFGRVALESVMMGVPVLTTDRGGLPEIVEDKKFGYVCNPEIKSLIFELKKIIENNVKLRRRIRKQTRILIDKFQNSPLTMHLNLYNEII